MITIYYTYNEFIVATESEITTTFKKNNVNVQVDTDTQNNTPLVVAYLSKLDDNTYSEIDDTINNLTNKLYETYEEECDKRGLSLVITVDSGDFFVMMYI